MIPKEELLKKRLEGAYKEAARLKIFEKMKELRSR